MTFYDDPMRPRPCFICLTEPAMAGHNVCSAHHDEAACRTCNPRVSYDTPLRVQTSGRRRNRVGSQ
jgi:hypothetical protein